jgi:organic radical activating enzyme
MKRIVPAAMHALVKEEATFKFVVADPRDLKEIVGLQSLFSIPSSSIYLMPEGKTQAELEKKQLMVVEHCIKFGYTFSPRLHVWLWGDKRKV